jgi:hypothetical protein
MWSGAGSRRSISSSIRGGRALTIASRRGTQRDAKGKWGRQRPVIFDCIDPALLQCRQARFRVGKSLMSDAFAATDRRCSHSPSTALASVLGPYKPGRFVYIFLSRTSAYLCARRSIGTHLRGAGELGPNLGAAGGAAKRRRFVDLGMQSGDASRTVSILK